LRLGDTVTVTIEGIGELSTTSSTNCKT